MSLLIGIHIKEVLLKDEALRKDIGDRVYPLVIPEGAPQYPFVVYESTGIQPFNTKDGSCEDSVGVSVAIVSKSYESVIGIANTVRYDLEGKTAKYTGFEVTECVLFGSAEDYLPDIDAVCVTLSFNMKTIDY